MGRGEALNDEVGVVVGQSQPPLIVLPARPSVSAALPWADADDERTPVEGGGGGGEGDAVASLGRRGIKWSGGGDGVEWNVYGEAPPLLRRPSPFPMQAAPAKPGDDARVASVDVVRGV